MDSEVADNVIGGEAAPVNMDGDLASDSDNQEGIAVAEDVVDDEEIEKNAPELSVEVTEVGELALEPEQKDDNEMVTNDSEPRPTTGISDNGEDAAQKVDALGTLQHEVKAVEGSAVVTDTLPPNDPVVTQPASQPSFGEKTLTGDVASTVPSSDPIDMINRIIANYEGTNSPATTVEVLPQSANVFPQPTAPYARPPTKNSKFIEVDPNYRMPGCCGRKLTSTTQKQSSPSRLTLRSESASRTKLGIEEDIIGAAEPPTFQHDATHIGMAKARQTHLRAQKKRTIPVVAIPPSPRCQPPTKRKNQSITVVVLTWRSHRQGRSLA